MTPQTRARIADVWFVLALLIPLYLPIALICMLGDESSGGVLMWSGELILTGPVALMRRMRPELPEFFTLCLAPTLLAALHALCLRFAANANERWSPLALVMLASKHLLFVVGFGGVATYWGSGAVVLSAISLVFYAVVGALLLRRASQVFAFEALLGLILSEHVLLPAVMWMTGIGG